MNTIEDDDADLPRDFDLENANEGGEPLPETEKNHHKLMQKRRAVEEKLAQLELERETRDFDFDFDDD